MAMNHVHSETNPAVEILEQRRLLSADVVNGTLVVVGTAGPDRIGMWEAIRDKGPVIVGYVEPLMVGSAPERFEIPAEGVQSVLVRAGAGDDEVDLSIAPMGPTTGPLSIPSRVDAGIGNDRVFGTVVKDFILGGFGNDQIDGENGNDWIDGGWGNDFLSGGRDNDVVSGGRGNDYVYGGEGDDRLYGGPGNDHVGFNGVGPLPSEPGNDVLSGGSGEDWMVGGQGKDRISGGTGRDHFSLEDDDSEMLDRTVDEPKDVPAGV
jgi:Ca2+-binding RTX toxin-like protein